MRWARRRKPDETELLQLMRGHCLRDEPPEQLFGGVTVEEDGMDAGTLREEGCKIIRDHTLAADVAVKTPCAVAFERNIPERDAARAQRLQSFIIWPLARGAAEFRHNLPKEIVRMRVILLRPQ